MSITLVRAKSVHPLASIVLSQLGGGKDAIESAIDAANHGADGGFSGFTYSSDCEKFVRRNRKAIAASVEAMADDLGENPIDMVAGFQCLKSDKPSAMEVAACIFGGAFQHGDSGQRARIYDALAWFALEEVGRAIIDNNER